MAETQPVGQSFEATDIEISVPASTRVTFSVRGSPVPPSGEREFTNVVRGVPGTEKGSDFGKKDRDPDELRHLIQRTYHARPVNSVEGKYLDNRVRASILRELDGVIGDDQEAHNKIRGKIVELNNEASALVRDNPLTYIDLVNTWTQRLESAYVKPDGSGSLRMANALQHIINTHPRRKVASR